MRFPRLRRRPGFLPVVLLASFVLTSRLVAAPEKAATIGLIGDSTVATTYGWGPAFAKRCRESATVLNYAKNGATLDSLSGKLDALLRPHAFQS